MKNKAQSKILAKAVYQALVDKNKKETTEIVDNFIAYLKQHHFLPLLSEILAELKVLEQFDKNILAVEIISARALDKHSLAEATKYLEHKSTQELDITETIDEQLLGGVKIKYQDKVLDLSLKKQINNLNKSLVN